MLKVLLAGQYPFALNLLASVLDSHSIQSTCLALPAHTAVPDDVHVALIDLQDAAADALQLIDQLARLPRPVPAIVHYRDHAQALLDQAVLAGAKGILPRDASTQQLLTALQKVHVGEVWIDRHTTARLFSRFIVDRSEAGSQVNALTAREREILTMLQRHSGKPAKFLAAQLDISESTLRNHLTAIYAKLGVRNRHGLVDLLHRHPQWLVI